MLSPPPPSFKPDTVTLESSVDGHGVRKPTLTHSRHKWPESDIFPHLRDPELIV